MTGTVSNPNVKAVVSYEFEAYLLPENELPEPITGRTRILPGVPVSMEDFIKLTQIPIVMYFSDNIPDEVTDQLGAEN